MRQLQSAISRVPGLIGAIFCSLLIVTANASSDSDTVAAPQGAPEYSEQGADTCLQCHGEGGVEPAVAIFQTKHAVTADPRTPFAKRQCETCHGAFNGHTGMRDFEASSPEARRDEANICLGCHQGTARTHWAGSSHENADITCVDCHRVHAAPDPVLTTEAQPGVCYGCHARVRADFYKASAHPVRDGQMICTDCHSPHGSTTSALLKRPTLNQTCYTCHAEKRGPFLWEHAPAPEDCTLCHQAHGSNHPALLTKRAPLLCQQCHSQAGHPSITFTSAGLPSGTASGFLLSSGCLNCHSQVHGSNHPSGVRLLR